MPKRPPTLPERLRSLWAPEPAPRSRTLAGASAARQALGDKGSEFADRLRAAVSARQ